MIEDDDRLARAVELFLAEAAQRDRTPESSPATPIDQGARSPAGSPRDAGRRSSDAPSGLAAPTAPPRRIRVSGGSADQPDPLTDRRGAEPEPAETPFPTPILDAREWSAIVRREEARRTRHGRPLVVLAVHLARLDGADTMLERPGHPAGADDPDAARRYAVPLGDTLRRRARTSDRVARVASDRFSVMLLETDELGASAYADRIRSTCEPWIRAVPGDLALRIAWAVPGRSGSIEGADNEARDRVGASSVGQRSLAG